MSPIHSRPRALLLFAYFSAASAFAPNRVPSTVQLQNIPIVSPAQRRPVDHGVSPVSRPAVVTRLYQSSIRMDAGPTTEAEAAQQINTFVGAPASEKDTVSEFGTSNVSFLDLLGRTVQSEEFQRKVFNCLILLSSFGFAAYTILSIDNGMTRGWSSSEIAMRIPLDNWLNYENSLADRPIVTKTMINVIIYLLGDWLSQTVFCGKNLLDFDAGRTLRNGFIGLCFGPLVHEYYQFSDHILPVEGGMLNRFEKILMDQTIYLTVKCSIYISAVGLLNGDDVPTVTDNVKNKLPSIVLTAWKFWPLVHLVTYGFIPARHRILWVNCVDLVWNAILAGMSQRGENEDDQVPAEDVAPLMFEATEDAATTAAHTSTLTSLEDNVLVENLPTLSTNNIPSENTSLSSKE